VASSKSPRRGTAVPTSRKSVSASVRLDLITHARVAAAAALAGMDRGTWINEAIQRHLKGIVVFDKLKTHESGESADRVIGEDVAA
jgi:hypothetical protein